MTMSTTLPPCSERCVRRGVSAIMFKDEGLDVGLDRERRATGFQRSSW